MSWLYTCVSRMYLQFVCLGLLWTWQDVIVLTGCWFWSFCSINSHCVKTKSKFNDSNYYLRLSVIPSLSFATFRVESHLLLSSKDLFDLKCSTNVGLGELFCRHLLALRSGWLPRSYKTPMGTMRRSDMTAHCQSYGLVNPLFVLQIIVFLRIQIRLIEKPAYFQEFNRVAGFNLWPMSRVQLKQTHAVLIYLESFAGRYMVIGNHSNRNGKRWATSCRSAPYASSIPHSKEQPPTGRAL